MKEVYELSDAIQWHEGMLLSPQHFQQQARRFEQLLHYQLMTSTPFFWGVRHLRIDPVFLVSGRFCILEMEAIMPDGLLCWHNVGEDNLELDLTESQDALQNQSLTVYLIVPALRRDKNAFNGDLARYESVDGQPIVDDNTGDGAVHIPRLRPRLKLLISAEAPAQKFTYIPLAQITYKDEAFALTDFIAPILNVLPATPLHEHAVALATRVREKASFLVERLRMPSYASRIDKPLLFETQNIIQGLVTSLPPVEAIIYAKTGHPYHLYLALCGLAGSLAGFAGALLPPVFPGYDQNQLRATFDPVFNFIDRILDNIHESYMAIPFQFEDKLFTLLPLEDWLQKRFIIGIHGRPGTTEEDLVEWIDSAVICSRNHTRNLRERRVLGASRKRVEKDDELGLVPTKGMLLFEILVDDDSITEEQPLEIMNAAKIDQYHRPNEIIFYAPNKITKDKP